MRFQVVSLCGRIYLPFFRKNMVYLSEYQKAMKTPVSRTWSAFEYLTQASAHLRPTYTWFLTTNTNTNKSDDSISKWDTLVHKELMPVILSPQYSTFCPVKHSRGRLGPSHMFCLLPRWSTVHAKNVGPDILNEREVSVHVSLRVQIMINVQYLRLQQVLEVNTWQKSRRPPKLDVLVFFTSNTVKHSYCTGAQDSSLTLYMSPNTLW